MTSPAGRQPALPVNPGEGDDVCIGARLVLTGRAKQWVGIAAWVFYLPALLLLARSSGATLLG